MLNLIRNTSNPFSSTDTSLQGPNERHRIVPDHVANRLHAERQAYLNSANFSSNTVGSSTSGRSATKGLNAALKAIGRPVLASLRAMQAVGKHTFIKAQGERHGKVVPCGPTSQFAGEFALESTSASAKFSPLSSPASPPACPHSSPAARSQRVARSPGEEKSDTPPASSRVLAPASPLLAAPATPPVAAALVGVSVESAPVRHRPALRLDPSALIVPAIKPRGRHLRAAARGLAESLHQTRSAPAAPPSSISSVSSAGSFTNPNINWVEPPPAEDINLSCCCGLDLLISRLVCGEQPTS